MGKENEAKKEGKKPHTREYLYTHKKDEAKTNNETNFKQKIMNWISKKGFCVWERVNFLSFFFQRPHQPKEMVNTFMFSFVLFALAAL